MFEYNGLVFASLSFSSLSTVVNAILLIFGNAYKQTLVRSGYTLLTFLPVEYEAEQKSGYNELVGMKVSLDGYSLSVVVKQRDRVTHTSFTDGREQRMKVLIEAFSISLCDTENICLESFVEEPDRTFESTDFQIWQHTVVSF